MIGLFYLFMTVMIYYPYYSLDQYTWFMKLPMFPFHDQWITPESYFHLLAGYMARMFFILAMGHFVDYIVKELTDDEKILKRFRKWVAGLAVVCVFELVATVNFICRFGNSFWLKGLDTLTIRAIVIFIVTATIATIEQRSKYAIR